MGMEDLWIPKRFIMGNLIIKTSRKTKNKMGAYCPDGHTIDPRNTGRRR